VSRGFQGFINRPRARILCQACMGPDIGGETGFAGILAVLVFSLVGNVWQATGPGPAILVPSPSSHACDAADACFSRLESHIANETRVSLGLSITLCVGAPLLFAAFCCGCCLGRRRAPTLFPACAARTSVAAPPAPTPLPAAYAAPRATLAPIPTALACLPPTLPLVVVLVAASVRDLTDDELAVYVPRRR
jgi:hypothetical protein